MNKWKISIPDISLPIHERFFTLSWLWYVIFFFNLQTEIINECRYTLIGSIELNYSQLWLHQKCAIQYVTFQKVHYEKFFFTLLMNSEKTHSSTWSKSWCWKFPDLLLFVFYKIRIIKSRNMYFKPSPVEYLTCLKSRLTIITQNTLDFRHCDAQKPQNNLMALRGIRKEFNKIC